MSSDEKRPEPTEPGAYYLADGRAGVEERGRARHDRTAQASAALLWSWWKVEQPLDQPLPWFGSMFGDIAARALEDTPQAEDLGARDELAKALARHVGRVLKRAGIGEGPPPGATGAPSPLATSNGVLLWTEQLAAYLDMELGKVGAELAAELRGSGAERIANPVDAEDVGHVVYDPFVGVILAEQLDGRPWAPWLQGAWLDALATAVWEDELRPRFKDPALTAHVVEVVVAALTGWDVDGELPGDKVIVDASGREVASLEGERIRHALAANSRGGVITADAVEAAGEGMLRARATIAAGFALHHAVATVTDRVRRGDSPDAVWPTWSAWVDEVADQAGRKVDSTLKKDLRWVAWFGNKAQLTLFDGRSVRGLWNLIAPDPFKRGRPPKDGQEVSFTYSPILRPDWAPQENPNDRNRGVRLVFIPPSIPLHPAIAAPNRAKAWAYSLFLLSSVTRRVAPQNATDGARFTTEDRMRVARSVALKPEDEARQLRQLQDAGLLVRVGEERLLLGRREAIELASFDSKHSKAKKKKRGNHPGKER